MRYAYDGFDAGEMANTAVGFEALRGGLNPSLNSGYFNAAFGELALHVNTSGMTNTAIGAQAMVANTTGSSNAVLGTIALFGNTTGNNNTAIGYGASSAGNNNNSTGLGYNAQPGANNTVRLGNNNVTTIGGYANWTNVSSDARIKTNVQENVPGLSFITRLRPVTYQLDMDAIAHITKTPDNLRLYDGEQLKAAEIQSGFIAQEVEAAAIAVGYDFHGIAVPQGEHQHYGLRYAEFVVPLVKAVQELAQENTALKESNTRLEQKIAELSKLEDRILALEHQAHSSHTH
jgi:hypothetical protein